MTPSVTELMAHCHERVDQALDRAINAIPNATSLSEAMRYSLFNGGKRVRPILVYASGLAVSPGLTPEGWSTLDHIACALEAIHAYSLVHDDLPAMDDDDLRRGKPTCHIAFDEATAILAGDALQTLAFELLCETPGLNDNTKLELLRQLTRAAGARGMVLGQALDLAAVNQPLDLGQLENMHRHKTGALISASVTMGATACGATPAQLQALETYAAAIGLAFQVQDDILDVTADTTTLGKQQGADAARNKPTYVSLAGLEGARKMAADLHQQALAALADFDERAQPLRQLATYIVERTH
jgi:geranylgeranyl diphosphate synthase type II